jgi:hypothetical protein
MKNDGITVKQTTEYDVDACTIKHYPLNTIFEGFIVDLEEVAELYNIIKNQYLAKKKGNSIEMMTN